MTNHIFFCDECKSRNVTVDATTTWNWRTQQNEITEEHGDGAYCQECEGECRIENEFISDENLERARMIHRMLDDTGLAEGKTNPAESMASILAFNYPDEAITDLLVNVMHFCHVEGINFDYQCEVSQRHYNEEKDQNNE